MRRLAGAGALVLVVVVATVAVVARAPAVELAAPAPGGVAADWLPDGTPVFVTRPHSEQVFVLDARVPRFRRQGLDVYVAACAGDSMLWGPFYGTSYDAAGHWVGGPAPQGLARYESELDGERVRVGRRLDPPARHTASPLLYRVRQHAGCAWTRDNPDTVQHFAGAERDALSPESAAAERHARPVLVYGAVERSGDGSIRACSWQPAETIQGPLCGDDAPFVRPSPFGWFDYDPDYDPGYESMVLGIVGLWRMTSEHGRLTIRAVMPEQLEYSESVIDVHRPETIRLS